MSYASGGPENFGILTEPIFANTKVTSTYIEFEITPINQVLLGRNGIVDPHVD